MSRLSWGLPAGPPPGRRKNGNAGKVAPRFRLLMREMFGDPLEVGAVSRYCPITDSTLNKWAKLGYIVRNYVLGKPDDRWRLTAKGKERAR